MALRGPGLTALSRHTTSAQAYSHLSSQLTAQNLADLRSQLDLFSSALRQFADTHRHEILNNAEFRGEFQRMCANIGVDPLGGGGGGGASTSSSKVGGVSGAGGRLAAAWNDWLGLGLADFNYALGVQIVDVCISTRDLNGGVIEVRDLIRRVHRLRTGGGSGGRGGGDGDAAGATSSSTSASTSISEDDVVRAIRTLEPLGCGYTVVALSSAPDAPKVVRSLPGELSLDSTLLLGLLADVQCPREGQYPFLTEEYVLSRQNKWTRTRARAALTRMNHDEGTLWIDYHRGQVRYFSLAVGVAGQ